MTCIVAIAQNGVVYMASDHAASDEKTGWILARKEPKVFKVGQYGIAFTDSFRMGQILQYSWVPPKYTPTKTNSGLDKFMRTKFVDSVKDAFKGGGYGNFGPNVEDGDQGGIFLVSVRGTGRLFYVDDDFQVGENIIPYYAEGIGMDFALGSLHSTQNMRDPYKRMELALSAASQFSVGVCPPYHYIEL